MSYWVTESFLVLCDSELLSVLEWRENAWLTPLGRNQFTPQSSFSENWMRDIMCSLPQYKVMPMSSVYAIWLPSFCIRNGTLRGNRILLIKTFVLLLLQQTWFKQKSERSSIQLMPAQQLMISVIQNCRGLHCCSYCIFNYAIPQTLAAISGPYLIFRFAQYPAVALSCLRCLFCMHET